MKSYCSGVVLLQCDTEMDTLRGRPCDDRHRDWRDVAISQGTSRFLVDTRSWKRTGRILPWSLKKERGPWKAAGTENVEVNTSILGRCRGGFGEDHQVSLHCRRM